MFNRMFALVWAFLVIGMPESGLGAAMQDIDTRMYHLGTPGFPEWSEYEGRRPHGRELHLEFEAQSNPGRKTVFLRQEGVKQGWGVYLNGKRLGNLVRSESRLEHSLPIPPQGLRAGKNTLSVRAPKSVDDIEVGRFRLFDGSANDALKFGIIDVQVTEAGNQLPARITVAHTDDTLAALSAAPVPSRTPKPAVRPGVVYLGNGGARISVLPGQYVVYASRGVEYSVASQRISVLPGKPSTLRFSLKREVDTKGWVSVDSHIHVLDFSGHGDSSVDERMMTIAGEGLELAISTDHNKHADYAPAAKKMGVNDRFSTVIGNEVTTKAGHFNAFPIHADAAIPDYKQTNWTQLIKGIRDTPGVQVIQLNHPRNVHGGYSPTSTNEFDLLTGDHPREIGFDAMEVVTSAAMQSDIMALFHDWFALLNRGRKIVGLASSDTHDVSRFILGQARTYVVADDRDPAKIDVDEVCRNLLSGRALISMGLLATIKVNDKYAVGDLVARSSNSVTATIEVTGPSWSTVDRIRIYGNGIKLADRQVESVVGTVKATETFRLDNLRNDTHLVAIATGPGVMKPFWETPRPYQLTSKTFAPLSIAATNPVWIDGDGNGSYDSPRATASRIVRESKGDRRQLAKHLERVDIAVVAQIRSLLARKGGTLDKPWIDRIQAALRKN